MPLISKSINHTLFPIGFCSILHSSYFPPKVQVETLYLRAGTRCASERTQRRGFHVGGRNLINTLTISQYHWQTIYMVYLPGVNDFTDSCIFFFFLIFLFFFPRRQARNRTSAWCAPRRSASRPTWSRTCASTRGTNRSRAACATRRSSGRWTCAGTGRASTPDRRPLNSVTSAAPRRRRWRRRRRRWPPTVRSCRPWSLRPGPVVPPVAVSRDAVRCAPRGSWASRIRTSDPRRRTRSLLQLTPPKPLVLGYDFDVFRSFSVYLTRFTLAIYGHFTRARENNQNNADGKVADSVFLIYVCYFSIAKTRSRYIV